MVRVTSPQLSASPAALEAVEEAAVEAAVLLEELPQAVSAPAAATKHPLQ